MKYTILMCFIFFCSIKNLSYAGDSVQDCPHFKKSLDATKSHVDLSKEQQIDRSYWECSEICGYAFATCREKCRSRYKSSIDSCYSFCDDIEKGCVQKCEQTDPDE